MKSKTSALEIKITKHKDRIKDLETKIKHIKDKRPKPRPHFPPSIIKICEEYFEELEDEEHNPDLVFVQVMELVYGKKVWEYVDALNDD